MRASQVDELGTVVGPLNNYGLSSPAVDWGNAGLPRIDSHQDLIISQFPHIIELNAILQVLPVDCILQITEGNRIAAFDDIQAILGLGRHMSQTIDGTFSGQLLSLSYAAECIQYAILEHPQLWTDAQWLHFRLRRLNRRTQGQPEPHAAGPRRRFVRVTER